MALLKSLLPLLVTCVAVIGSVAGAPTSPCYSVTTTATDTTTVVSERPPTTLLTVSTVTVGWGELPPSGPESPWPLNPTLASPATVDKRQSFTTKPVIAPIESNFVKSSETTTAEGRDEVQDMTLSLTASTASTSTTPTVFPDPGIFGRPPPRETDTTKHIATTTPSFAVVPPHLPDGTKVRRDDVGMTTTALDASTINTVPGMHEPSASASPVSVECHGQCWSHFPRITPAPSPAPAGHGHEVKGTLANVSPGSAKCHGQCKSRSGEPLDTLVKDRRQLIFPSITPRFYLFNAAERAPTDRLSWLTQVTTATRDANAPRDAVDNIGSAMPSQISDPTGSVFTSESRSISLPTQSHTIIVRPPGPTTRSPTTSATQDSFTPDLNLFRRGLAYPQ